MGGQLGLRDQGQQQLPEVGEARGVGQVPGFVGPGLELSRVGRRLVEAAEQLGNGVSRLADGVGAGVEQDGQGRVAAEGQADGPDRGMLAVSVAR